MFVFLVKKTGWSRIFFTIYYTLRTLYSSEDSNSSEVSQKKAQVYINNKSVGETPYQTALPPGEYTLRLSADGFDPFTRRIIVRTGSVLELNANLDVGGGTVEFQAAPNGAQLQLDGGTERYILPIRFDELKQRTFLEDSRERL